MIAEKWLVPPPTGRKDSLVMPSQGCASLPLGYFRPLPTGGNASEEFSSGALVDGKKNT
jgi:hypothetical protein